MTAKRGEVRLQIQAWRDRELIVTALANSGYSVRVVEEPPESILGPSRWFVVFGTERKTT